jgi:chemotaxis signal transduction protein
VAATTFVHFTVGDDRLALPLEEIREVARVSSISPVPRAPSVVRGLANIRGRVVTLLDMDVVYARDPASPPASVPAGHAVVLAPPRDHLALFTRSRVDIGRGGAAEIQEDDVAPVVRQAAKGAPGTPPAGSLVICDGAVAHLLPAAEIAAHCEARVLSRYRRRN